MTYRELPPPSDLRGIVACRWLRLATGGAEASIFPDGCTDILVVDDLPPRIAGPDASVRVASIAKGTQIVGLRLVPGAARAVFGCAATLLLDKTALLSDVAKGARALHERLLLVESFELRHALLEDWLRSTLLDCDRDVIAACHRLSREPSLAMASLAASFGWNARTMHRRFHAACGYGPKHLQRILRLQNTLRLARDGSGLRDIAVLGGYADQAHMTRDFRELTGQTPKVVLASASADYGAWLSETFNTDVRLVD